MIKRISLLRGCVVALLPTLAPAATLAQSGTRLQARATVQRLAEGGVVTPKEGCALITRGGFTPVDIRTLDEHNYAIAGAANVPIISGTWRFDAATKQRAPTEQRRNEAFLRNIVKRFPDASSPLLVHCSDGRSRSMSALQALEDVGYTRLAGIKGGYAAFAREFDAKLQPRHIDDIGRDPWREVDGNAAFADGQTTGLNHGSSFERMDNPDNLFPMKDPIQWMTVKFTEAEIAEAKALLAVLRPPAVAPQHASVKPAAVPASPAAMSVAQAGALRSELSAEPAAAAEAAFSAKEGPAGRGEARGEYVIFRF